LLDLHNSQLDQPFAFGDWESEAFVHHEDRLFSGATLVPRRSDADFPKIRNYNLEGIAAPAVLAEEDADLIVPCLWGA
jgi:hypothetical protein